MTNNIELAKREKNWMTSVNVTASVIASIAIIATGDWNTVHIHFEWEQKIFALIWTASSKNTH